MIVYLLIHRELTPFQFYVSNDSETINFYNFSTFIIHPSVTLTIKLVRYLKIKFTIQLINYFYINTLVQGNPTSSFKIYAIQHIHLYGNNFYFSEYFEYMFVLNFVLKSL
jgi:hypothetical protein